jgi:hypothetical protein
MLIGLDQYDLAMESCPISTGAHVYPTALQGAWPRPNNGEYYPAFLGCRGGAMQVPGYELPRNPILGTSVHKPSVSLFGQNFIGNSSPPVTLARDEAGENSTGGGYGRWHVFRNRTRDTL